MSHQVERSTVSLKFNLVLTAYRTVWLTEWQPCRVPWGNGHSRRLYLPTVGFVASNTQQALFNQVNMGLVFRFYHGSTNPFNDMKSFLISIIILNTAT